VSTPVRAIHSVPDLPAEQPPPAAASMPVAGEYELMARAELDALGELADRMSGQSAVVIAMARILDNPAAVLQHTAAAGQLRAQLALLQEAAKSARRTTGKVRMLRSRHVG
jgi:hypothetical protein